MLISPKCCICFRSNSYLPWYEYIYILARKSLSSRDGQKGSLFYNFWLFDSTYIENVSQLLLGTDQRYFSLFSGKTFSLINPKNCFPCSFFGVIVIKNEREVIGLYMFKSKGIRLFWNQNQLLSLHTIPKPHPIIQCQVVDGIAAFLTSPQKEVNWLRHFGKNSWNGMQAKSQTLNYSGTFSMLKSSFHGKQRKHTLIVARQTNISHWAFFFHRPWLCWSILYLCESLNLSKCILFWENYV